MSNTEEVPQENMAQMAKIADDLSGVIDIFEQNALDENEIARAREFVERLKSEGSNEKDQRLSFHGVVNSLFDEMQQKDLMGRDARLALIGKFDRITDELETMAA